MRPQPLDSPGRATRCAPSRASVPSSSRPLVVRSRRHTPARARRPRAQTSAREALSQLYMGQRPAAGRCTIRRIGLTVRSPIGTFIAEGTGRPTPSLARTIFPVSVVRWQKRRIRGPRRQKSRQLPFPPPRTSISMQTLTIGSTRSPRRRQAILACARSVRCAHGPLGRSTSVCKKRAARRRSFARSSLKRRKRCACGTACRSRGVAAVGRRSGASRFRAPAQIKRLTKQSAVLVRNISILFRTAQAELQRKDRTIAELRFADHFALLPGLAEGSSGPRRARLGEAPAPPPPPAPAGPS
jgi:hypothetical protein